MNGAGHPSIFDEAHFREVLGHFATGVTIVTSLDGDEPIGFTCQSFTSLSLEPPMILIAPARTSTTWPRIEATGRFAVNILSETQEALCRTFAVSGADKFSGIGWHRSSLGNPVLADTVGFIDCAVHEIYPAGDHFIVVANVEELGLGAGRPLLYYRSGFGSFLS